MLKMALLDCAINEKCCSADGGQGICPLFSSPPPGDLTAQESPPPGNLPSKATKKVLIPGGQPREGVVLFNASLSKFENKRVTTYM